MTKYRQGERIQKVIARAGRYSRREVEKLVHEGRITVNGVVPQQGHKVQQGDSILIDNAPVRLLSQPHETIIIAYNKRVGEVCSRKTKNSVYDSLPDFCPRWVGVGRLDINTSGLLLFTNNGLLAHQLAHPSAQLDREYAVRVRGNVTAAVRDTLLEGVQLEDGTARFLDIVQSGGSGSNQWVHVVVQEGRNRLVRRIFQSQGLEVSRLIRVRFATVVLTSSIRAGCWVQLGAKEAQKLQDSVRGQA